MVFRSWQDREAAVWSRFFSPRLFSNSACLPFSGWCHACFCPLLSATVAVTCRVSEQSTEHELQSLLSHLFGAHDAELRDRMRLRVDRVRHALLCGRHARPADHHGHPEYVGDQALEVSPASAFWSATTCRRFPFPNTFADPVDFNLANTKSKSKAVTSHRTPRCVRTLNVLANWRFDFRPAGRTHPASTKWNSLDLV